MKSDTILIRHVLEATARIHTFISGLSYQVFKTDEKTISAVVRELIVIGEAIGSLSEEFRQQYPEIPFYEIGGMRT